MIKGMGGAMDLVAGVKKIIVVREHTSKNGDPKFLPACSLPLTGKNVVDMIVTDLAVLDVNGPDRTLRLLSTHPGVTVEQVLEASGCAIHVEGSVPQTRVPTTEELLVIREVLDPKGLRFKEVPVPKEESA